jgi:hypothetical protein
VVVMDQMNRAATRVVVMRRKNSRRTTDRVQQLIHS